MLENMFKLSQHGTTVRTEVLAGFTTFLTMAYISIVNPLILADAGMDFGGVFVATCLAAAFGTFIMGFWANYPIALAPGMGLNAYFTYTVVKTLGFTWQVGLGAVFLSGLIFLVISGCWQVLGFSTAEAYAMQWPVWLRQAGFQIRVTKLL